MHVFKIVHLLESTFLLPYSVTDKARSVTRWHPFDITKVQSVLDKRKYSFTQWFVNDWNIIPNAPVKSKKIKYFIGHIYKYLNHRTDDYTSQRLTPCHLMDCSNYEEEDGQFKSE